MSGELPDPVDICRVLLELAEPAVVVNRLGTRHVSVGSRHARDVATMNYEGAQVVATLCIGELVLRCRANNKASNNQG